MKNLRVLLTCEDYLPQVGGAEICVFNVARELRRRGHRVTIFTNTTERTADEEEIVRVPWRFSPGILWRNVRTLWRLIGESDVVHCTYSFRIAAICAVICKLQAKPMLLTQQGRGIVPEVNPKWCHALLVRLCQVVSMRGAGHITATSEEIADLTAAFVPRSRITVHSNGFDAELFAPDALHPVPPAFARLPEGTMRFLTVRRLVPKNGIHILIQALLLVRDRNPAFRYIAIGDGRARPFIESLIESLHLTDHVTLLGALSNEAAAPYVRHADLVLFPSSAEAQSIACIEAMGAGKPVIASRVGGLIDLLRPDERYGALVRIYDSETSNYEAPQTLPRERLQPLADAILSFMGNPSVLREKARAAAAFAREHYSWGAITEQYEEQYRRLLAHRSHPLGRALRRRSG